MIDVESYCRDLEAYLCQKNDGHLIRITGPAFERIQSWANQGIPLKVAQAGIDRYFERYYRKGPRRRPVQITFCEADVLEVFDEWRRAVGLSAAAQDPEGGPDVEEPASTPRTRRSLATQIEGAIARLTVAQGSGKGSSALRQILGVAIRELDGLRAGVSRARGEQRAAIMQHVMDLEETVLQAAVNELSDTQRAAFEEQAMEELAAFRDRMTKEAYAQSRRAAVLRLVRDHFGLPSL